jgi:hypothetical protein
MLIHELTAGSGLVLVPWPTLPLLAALSIAIAIAIAIAVVVSRV